MESKSFPPSFDIARRYAKHQKQDYLRYGELGRYIQRNEELKKNIRMEYDKTKFTAWTWKHWVMIHWILNPGLVINELILGQRVPKVILFDKTMEKPFMERQFVPCPHCGELNDGRLWSKKNSFKNWFGYYCPNCGNAIPCLRNLTSLVVIILSFPI